MFNALLYIAQSGSLWRELTAYYPSWKSVYTKFCCWRDSGPLNDLFLALNDDPDLENLMIDSTIVPAHQHSVGSKKGPNSQIGQSWDGKATKIHTLVDALGNPLYFLLTGGQYHDGPQAFKLLENVTLQSVNVIGDRAYNAAGLRQYIRTRGGSYTISPRTNY